VQFAAWRALLERKSSAPALSLCELARDAELSERCAQKRWRSFEKARAAGVAVPAALDAAAADGRGGHNRMFSAEHEQLLASVLQAPGNMTHPQIQATALQFKRDVDVATGAHSTRSKPLFRASDGFVSALKRRQRLSSHRTAVVHESRVAVSAEEKEDEKCGFVVQVRDAIDRYGADSVFNMDETPVTLLDVPTTAVVTTGSKQAARISTPANVGTKITTLATISAAGNKLSMCAVLKGKTSRVLKKITEDAGAEIKKVKLYYSEKGWINEGIMALYFRDVLLPRTHAAPAALVVDGYRAHFTPAVQEAAAAMNLELIQVPAGCTSTLQPLDVNFNGPLLAKRKHLWAQKKLVNPFAEDSAQAAIQRAQEAYDEMDKSLVLSAWRKAFLID
jgi:hypothetical protein